jgi:cytochrome c oxidase assembly protein subunit 11
MTFSKKFLFISFLILIFISLSYFLTSQLQKKKSKSQNQDPIILNLLTSVHPKLSWTFVPIKPKISVKPGEVITIKYTVENKSENDETGIATFSYFPREFGEYITKMNCFCYDAQNLKANEKSTYTVVMLIDPAVTKDNKTKNTKEVTIQFTFFDYKEYKDSNS